MQKNTDVLLTSAAVRKMMGDVSDMTLWRWGKDPALNFPDPIRIKNRKYWELGDLAEFKKRMAARG